MAKFCEPGASGLQSLSIDNTHSSHRQD